MCSLSHVFPSAVSGRKSLCCFSYRERCADCIRKSALYHVNSSYHWRKTVISIKLGSAWSLDFNTSGFRHFRDPAPKIWGKWVSHSLHPLPLPVLTWTHTRFVFRNQIFLVSGNEVHPPSLKATMGQFDSHATAQLNCQDLRVFSLAFLTLSSMWCRTARSSGTKWWEVLGEVHRQKR